MTMVAREQPILHTVDKLKIFFNFLQLNSFGNLILVHQQNPTRSIELYEVNCL